MTIKIEHYNPILSPPGRKLTAEEYQARQADQQIRICLRVMICCELAERDIATPDEIGKALGMVPTEAMTLLNRHQWQEGDLLLLKAIADKLGLQVSELRP